MVTTSKRKNVHSKSEDNDISVLKEDIQNVSISIRLLRDIKRHKGKELRKKILLKKSIASPEIVVNWELPNENN